MEKKILDIDNFEAYIKPCLRSGFCCKKATCTAGLAFGAEAKGCKFLLGNRPGEYACQLIVENKVSKEDLAIGAGCCCPLNTDRKGLKLEKK